MIYPPEYDLLFCKTWLRTKDGTPQRRQKKSSLRAVQTILYAVGSGLKYVSYNFPPCTLISLVVECACDQLNFRSAQIGPSVKPIAASRSIPCLVSCSVSMLVIPNEPVVLEKGIR